MSQIVKFVFCDPVFQTSFNKQFQPPKLKNGHLLYNMSSSDLKSIFLICLHQDDNHTSHAVAAVDNFILDLFK